MESRRAGSQSGIPQGLPVKRKVLTLFQKMEILEHTILLILGLGFALLNGHNLYIRSGVIGYLDTKKHVPEMTTPCFTGF